MRNSEEYRRTEDEIDLRMLFYNLKKHWSYFLFSILLFSVGALLYIRYTLPVYEATTSVIIKDNKNASKNIEDILSGDMFGNNKNIATEIGILQSRSVLEKTFEELNLDVSFYSKSGLLNYPLYKTTPFVVKALNISEGVYEEEFHISSFDSTGFKLEIEVDNRFIKNFKYSETHAYGEEIKTPYFNLIVSRNLPAFSFSTDEKYFFTINSVNKLLAYYKENMSVMPLNKEATIVQITVYDKIPERALDFLNTLGKVYIGRDLEDKSSVAALTLKFVDEQLEEISKKLNASEIELQKFKEQKGTVDLSEESKAYLERVTSVDEDRVKAEIDLRSLNYLYDYVSGNKDVETLAPSSLGNPDPLLVDLITRLKGMQSKRKGLIYGSSAQSPAIKIIDEQIEQTKKALIENINSIRNLTSTSLKGLNNQLYEYENSIRKIPNLERELLGIRRNFTVNENIYLYLLQKKAETGIAKATAVSDNKVLDDASVEETPVIPDKKTVIIISFLLAFILPVIIILLQGYIKNTINNKEDIEKLTKIPIIGVVGHLKTAEKLVVSKNPKSSIAEAFRSIRANLMYFGLTDQNKIILITSSVGGEGKSFTTLNLATVLSLQHHKVIIIGMDLRKPQLIKELGVENNDGISTLLIGKTTLEKVIQKTTIDGLDIISSGPIPPNPAELLSKKETQTLLHELRTKYDYIIIDTPPVGIVSDAMLLMNYADINIFILRENYSRKEYLRSINNYYTEGKIKNLCILLNDAGTNKSYGYYSHGYYEEDTKQSGIIDSMKGIFQKGK